MSRLTIDMTEKQHQSIEAMAAIEGKSIEKYAVERLFPVLPDEAQAFDELKALLERRMHESAKGEVLAQSITEIARATMKASRPA
jgi:hypothetical protein